MRLERFQNVKVMPFKTGLSEKRREALLIELEKMIDKIIELGVEKVILFGSLANNSVGKSSDIDLIVVKNTSEKFLDRLETFYRHLKPRVGVDILVYTPEEFERMKDENQFIRTALKSGRVLYEK